MAFRAGTTHTPMGKGTSMLAQTTNAPTFTTVNAQGSDTYCMTITSSVGGDVTYMRLTARGADGITASINTKTPRIQGWFRPTLVPVDEEFLILGDSQSATDHVTGRMMSLRIRADGKVRMHDSTALASGTATGTTSWSQTLSPPIGSTTYTFTVSDGVNTYTATLLVHRNIQRGRARMRTRSR